MLCHLINDIPACPGQQISGVVEIAACWSGATYFAPCMSGYLVDMFLPSRFVLVCILVSFAPGYDSPHFEVVAGTGSALPCIPLYLLLTDEGKAQNDQSMPYRANCKRASSVVAWN